MKINYNIDIDSEAIINNFKRWTNQIYKLLPNREEHIDWETPLQTIIEDFSGMAKLIPMYQEDIFLILCKLEGLYSLKEEKDFFPYRRTIFECLNLLQALKEKIKEDDK